MTSPTVLARTALPALAALLSGSIALAGVTGPGGGPIPAPAPCFLAQTSLASQCYDLEVTCPADPTWVRSIRIKESAPAGTAVGNVLFTTGATGKGIYSATPNRETTVVALKNAGFRTFELQWTNTNGWLDGAYVTGASGSGPGTGSTRGFAPAACGYAQIAAWLGANRMPTGFDSVCATGNSLGGGLIAHAMTSYAGDGFFRAIVYSGGPSTSLPFEVCFGASTAQGKSHSPIHYGIIDTMAGWSHADAGVDNYCTRGVPPPPDEEAALKQQGLVSVATLPSFPEHPRDYDSSNGARHTRQFIVVGAADGTGATFHANAFHAKLLAADPTTATPEYVSYPGSLYSQPNDDFLHDIDETAAGAYLIARRLVAYCRPYCAVSGDANGDLALNVADVFQLIGFLFAGGAAPAPGCADVNKDANQDVVDVFYLINHLFAGGPAPL